MHDDVFKFVISTTFTALIGAVQILILFIVNDIRSRVTRLESMHMEAKS